jgi:hypothetical protein
MYANNNLEIWEQGIEDRYINANNKNIAIYLYMFTYMHYS